MDQLKPFLQLFSDFLHTRSDLKTTLNDVADSLLQRLHQELLLILLKLLGGIILTAAAIYSFLSIGDQINFILMTEENGATIAILAFLLLLMVCCYLLILLFRPQEPPPPGLPANQTPPPTKDPVSEAIERLALAFIEGLIDGLEKHRRQNESMPPSPHPVTADDSGEMP